MAAKAWMPLYVGDYLADTMGLTGAEHGAYLLLIMHYWRCGPLPNDDKALASIACTPRKHWPEIGATVRRFFQAGEDGLLHHKRIDKELAKSTSISEKRRAAALAKAMQMQSKCTPLAPDLHVQSQSQSQREEESSSSTPEIARATLDANGRVILPKAKKGAVPFDGATIEPETGKVCVAGWYWEPVLAKTLAAARIDPARWTGTYTPLIRWLTDEIEPDTIYAVIRAIAERPDYRPPASLAYFDRPIRNPARSQAA